MPRTPLLAAVLAAATFCVTLATPIAARAADSMRPGLWEISSKVKSGSSQAMAAMAEAQKQMAGMAPEQRKMIEAMMAKQGMGMAVSGDGIKVTHCVTKEMAERRQIPMGQQGQCTNTTTATANGVNLSFTCANPPSSGSGQVTFHGDTGFATTMNVTSAARGKQETMAVEATGRWLGSECGGRTPPQ